MNDSSNSNHRQRRMRRSLSKWAQLIEAQSASGLSIVGFCREHGLAANSFYRWRRRLEGSAATRSAQRPFVRLRMPTDGDVSAGRSSAAAMADHRPVVVRFVDGVELHIDSDRLSEVLTLLRDGSTGRGMA